MALTDGARTGLGVAGAVALAVAVILGAPLLRDRGPEAPEPVASAGADASGDTDGGPVADAALPATDVSAPELPAPEADVTQAAPATLVAPTIDVVRFEPDGSGIVAGQAPAGITVAILIDGGLVLETVADADGRFVDFLTLPASGKARTLSLVADPGGDAVPSDQTVLIAPTPEVVVAEAPQADAVGAEGQFDPAGPAEQADASGPADAATAQTDAAEPAQAGAEQAVTEAVEAEPPAVPGETGVPEALLAEAGAEAVADPAAPAATEAGAPQIAEAAIDPAAPGGVETGETQVSDAGSGAAPDASASGQTDATAPQMAEASAGAEADPAPSQVTSADASQVADAGAATDAAPQAGDAVASLEAPAATGSAPELAAIAPAAPQDPAAPPAAPDVAAAPLTEDSTAPPVVDADIDPIAPPDAAVGAAPVLVSDAAGVRVLQPARPAEASPEVLRTVALDAISYDASGEVTLAGRATTGGTVRLYLDNAPRGDTPVAGDGTWSKVLEDVPPGIYTLRADQIAADGRVVSRIETPFLREERATIAAVLAEETQAEDFNVAVRTVQPGNTLWAIARERYGEGILYVAVFEANKDLIRDPDLIYPGQIFRLPEISE